MHKISVATPFPVLIGVYLLCFIFILLWAFFAADRGVVLNSLFWNYVWADALIRFLQYFIAIHCSGVLIAFSLFIKRNIYTQQKVLFRFMSVIILTLIVITSLYVFVYETVYPLVYAYKKELSSISNFSSALYKGAVQKQAQGAYKEALTYVDLSLSMDGNNQDKISTRLEIIKNLAPGELHAYEQEKSGGGKSPLGSGDDVQSILQKAENALKQENYADAYSYAEGVLVRDSKNTRALWISNISWEEISSAGTADSKTEKMRYLINEKRKGYEAYAREDHIDAYYIFKALEKQYPDDAYVQSYLGQIEAKLPDICFFKDEAELILSLPGAGRDYLVFFNNKDETNREIVSIDRVAALKDGMFFKNVEVIGFLKDGSVLYHYSAPYGKLIDHYININGLDRDEIDKRSLPDYYKGVPPLDNVKGIKLNIDPLDFSYYELEQEDIKMMSIWQLLKAMVLTKDYANYSRILFLEIVFKISIPFLLIIFSLVCARIAISQSSAYISSPPRILYLFLPIIPFIVFFIVDIAVYIYKIIIGFIYFSLGGVLFLLLLAGGFILITALLFYGITRRMYKDSQRQAG